VEGVAPGRGFDQQCTPVSSASRDRTCSTGAPATLAAAAVPNSAPEFGPSNRNAVVVFWSAVGTATVLYQNVLDANKDKLGRIAAANGADTG
jgi:hypothetical protein